ncbi:MAG: zinc-dependent peptidase [Bacteroidota bacterium]
MVTPTLILFCGALTVAFFVARKLKGRKRSESGNDIVYERLCEEVKRKSYYYHQLNGPEQVLYLQRTCLFFHEKEFLARGFDEVSFHMKAVIASYAAQITFGFDDVRLQHFKTIVIYPSPYQSTITRQWHKGETHKEGAVVFSWKDLREGHESPKDGVNLALHEFAHALRLENGIENDEYRFLSEIHLQRFDELAVYERSRMQQGNQNLLRDYAATNNQEFFAVCIENFFERPRLFKEAAPEMYGLLVHVLQQDLLSNPVRLRL